MRVFVQMKCIAADFIAMMCFRKDAVSGGKEFQTTAMFI